MTSTDWRGGGQIVVCCSVCLIIEKRGRRKCVDYDRWPGRPLGPRHDLRALSQNHTFLSPHLSAVAALLGPTVAEAVVCRVRQRLVQDLCKVWPPFRSILQGLLWGERSPLAFMRARFTVASPQIMALHYWLAKSVWKNCFDCILSYGAVCLNVMRSSLGFLIG